MNSVVNKEHILIKLVFMYCGIRIVTLISTFLNLTINNKNNKSLLP